MRVETALLTGGRSSRMGTDKASLTVDGEPMGVRMARLLAATTAQVTVLGRTPIAGHSFLEDQSTYRGPLAALSRFRPAAEAVFVAACDMPLFDPRIVGFLADRLEQTPAAAVVPSFGGHVQPLCGLYRACTFGAIPRSSGAKARSMMAWLDALQLEIVEESELESAGIDPSWYVSADTQEAFTSAMDSLKR